MPPRNVQSRMHPQTPFVLGLGETQVATGYARVLDSLLRHLRDSFRVEEIALLFDPSVRAPEWPLHFPDRSTPAAECDSIVALVRRLRPSVLLINQDIHWLPRLAPALRQVRDEVRIVYYGPVDGPVLHPQVIDALYLLHAVVLYTPTQGEAVRIALGRRIARSTTGTPWVTHIGVGIDTRLFFPDPTRCPPHGDLLQRRLVRRRLFGTTEFADAFIVLNANRNTLRKRIDLTVAAFAEFARRRSRPVLLWLHMSEHGSRGWNLTRLARGSLIEHRIIRGYHRTPVPAASASHLHAIYNACDVGLNTSVGEGWGLVSLEHAATGAAQIVPSHSVHADLWQAAALHVRSYRPFVTGAPYTEEWSVDANEAARYLAFLYEDGEFLRRMTLAALEHATEPRFSWERRVIEWSSLLSCLTDGEAVRTPDNG